MNNVIGKSAFALALAAGLTGVAQAAVDRGELSVSGTIRPPSCVVTIADNGIFDYGLMSQSMLPVTGHLALPEKTQRLRVACDAQTYMLYSISDKRAGSASLDSTVNFGLGSVPGTAGSKIGYYSIDLSNAEVDGVARPVTKIGSAGAVPAPTTAYDKSAMGFTWAALNSYLQLCYTANGSSYPCWITRYDRLTGSTFDVDLTVKPFLANKTVVGGGSPVTEMVNMDGMATITFAFGI